MANSITHTVDGDTLTVHINGELNDHTAPELRKVADKVAEERHAHVTADLAGLDLIDSSGVGGIVMLYHRVRANGGQFRIANIRDQPAAIFKLLRLDKVFDL